MSDAVAVEIGKRRVHVDVRGHPIGFGEARDVLIVETSTQVPENGGLPKGIEIMSCIRHHDQVRQPITIEVAEFRVDEMMSFPVR